MQYGNSSVEVTNNHVVYSHEPHWFEFQATSNITGVALNTATVVGQSMIKVTATNLFSREALSTGAFPSSDIACRFDKTTSAGLYFWQYAVRYNTGNNYVECKAPALKEGFVALEIANNALDFTDTGMSFEFSASPTVNYVYPRGGPISGGNSVTILGSGFTKATAYCRFGASTPLVAGIVMSTTEVVCVAPVHLSGAVNVQVTNMDDSKQSFSEWNYSPISVQYVYISDIRATGLATSAGPALGGAKLTVYSNVANAYYPDPNADDSYCVFDNTLFIGGTWRNRTSLECVSPAHIGMNTTFTMQSGTTTVSAPQQILYEFVSAYNLTSMTPSSGPAYGGTVLTIGTPGMTKRDGLNCRINLAFVPASMDTPGIVKCATKAESAGYNAIEIVNGETDESSWSASELQFLYIDEISDLSVWPQEGSSQGGTVVTLSGSSFPEFDYACKFGDSELVRATYQSSNMLTCVTPPHINGKIKIALVDASHGHIVSYGNTMYFKFTTLRYTDTLTPFVGDVMGGTFVTATGDVEVGGDVQCWFGDVVVDATEAGGVITCSTPAGSAVGNTTMGVTLRGDTSTPQAQFEFHSVMNVSSVSKVTVVPDTTVTLTGAGFSTKYGMYCGLGGSSEDGMSWGYAAGAVASSSRPAAQCLLVVLACVWWRLL
jgi:hypothetical protein